MTTKIATTNIQDSALTTLLGPKVTTIVYPGTETATDTAGGETINLTGNGFQSGCSVLVASTSASVVTFISSTQISFTAPAQSAGTYVIYVINPDGGTAISIPGISYSGTPNWTTTAGSLGTAYEAGSISATLTATGDAPITYVLATGTLPTGSSLASNGTLSGTAPATASATTYNFTITAKDAQNQTTNRAFSLTINPDVVTWSSPASLTTYNVNTNTAIANVTMSATSASGGSITYTADTLPTGLSITGANIAGTPTVVASTTTVLTATATSTRTATRTINWVVTVANDTYFKNTTLLLNGETTVTPFISDSSTNNFGLTIVGDTKPVLFNPYQGDGYYSNYFDGSGDYLTIPSNSAFDFGSSNFTIETWVYITVGSGYKFLISRRANGSSYGPFCLGFNGTSPYFAVSSTGSAFNIEITGSSLSLNTWYHIAAVRNGSTYTLYVNGTSVATGTSALSLMASSVAVSIGAHADGSEMFGGGYISNSRIVNGTAVYTSAFTPSTTPLTAISGTSLLTCQSNRLIDKSTNNFTITKNGDVSVSPAIPFAASSSYSTYGSTYFDGNGDYLTIASTSALGIASSDFTIELWAYFTDAANTQEQPFVVNITPSGFLINTFWFGKHSVTSGKVTVYIYNYSSSTYFLAESTLPPANMWTHYALVRSGNTFTIYRNGISSVSGTFAGAFTSTTSPAWIGRSGDGADANSFKGYISDFRIVKGTAVYTTTFTPPTSPLTAIANTSLLTLQYNGGANNYGIIDNSNFNNIITRSGNATQGTFSPYSQTGWSNYFDGSSSNIVSASTTAFNLSTSNFSIEMWFYWNGTYPSGNGYAGLCGSATDYKVALCIWNGSGGSIPKIMYGLSSNGSAWNILAAESSVGSNTVLANQWNHIVLCRNVNTISGFLNGARDITVTSSASVVSRTEGYVVGSWFSTLYYFSGYISNFRFMVGGSIPYDAGLSTIAVPTTSLTAVTGTQFLTCQSNRLIDNSSNAFAITRNGNTSVQAFNPFNSGISYTPSLHGGSAYFDGTGDYLSLPSNSVGAFGTGDFTIECWIYLSGSNINYRTIVSTRSSNGTTTGWCLATNASGDIYIYSGAFLVTASSAIVPSTWYHVAVCRLSGTTTLYLNGVSKATSSTARTYSDAGLSISADPYGVTELWQGYISDLRVVKGTAVYTSNFVPPTQTLTNYSTTYPSSLLLNFTNGGIVDQHSSNVLETVGNAQLSTAVKKYNNASIYFDGTGDYLTSPSSPNYQFGTGDFTVEFWIYFNAVNNSTVKYIYDMRNSGATSASILAQEVANSWTYWNGAGTQISTGFTSSTFSATTWTHVAICRSSGVTKFFVNGTQTNSVADTSNYSNSTLVVGARYSYSDGLNGYIDDLRITKGYARYTSNFTAPTSALITK